MVALMAAVCVNAQVFKAVPGNSTQAAVPKAPQATIDPAAGQVWWGYISESDLNAYNAIGIGQANVFFMAGIYIPANDEEVGSSTIKAVRVHVLSGLSSTMSNANVWISKTLPTTLDAADYVQEVKTLEDGANDIALTTPYVVNNEGFYIGYSVTSTNTYPIMCCGSQDAPNTFLISYPNSGGVMQWSDLNGMGFGKLAFQILVEGGNFVDYSAVPEDFKPAVVELGQTVDVPVNVTSMGAETISSLSYTVTANGTTSAEKTINGLSIAYKSTAKVSFPIEAAATVGTSAVTITLTKVNGNDNAATNKSATGNVATVESVRTWPRNVLIEEFTTEKCVYCPQAASGLASFMSTYPELAARVAVACHHDGYYTDWLTVPASTSYCWFYNAGGGTYAPAFMYDRFAGDDTTPVVNRESNAAGYKNRVENRLAVESYANIELASAFNADNSQISVKADCERGWDFSSTPARITLFVTEDNITARSQSGASGTFIHQHVLRAVNATWGAVLDWDNNKSVYEYTFNVDSSWKTDDLKVIAFISGYDSTDPTNCVVENVSVVVPSAASTDIKGVEAVRGNNTVEARYTLDGRQISAPQKGLNIVKMADGSVRKVMVK